MRLKFSKFNIAVGLILLVKLALGAFFSSDYQNLLFIPFVSHFIHTFDNPWQFVWAHHLPIEFPYPPVMLAVYSIGLGLSHVVGVAPGSPIETLLFKLPSIIADGAIFYLLLTLFPSRKRLAFWTYWCSPIILYAVYMHSQLDLVPTALLFASLVALFRNKDRWGALLLGLSIGAKFHNIVAVPFLLIALYRRKDLRAAITTGSIALGTFALTILPFSMTQGFWQLVFRNPKQLLIFQTTLSVGGLQVIVPFWLIGVLLIQFFSFKKINDDLLMGYLGIVFACFVLLVSPSPGWYVWVTPFLAHFLIKYSSESRLMLAFQILLPIAYLTYFIGFHTQGLVDLRFVGRPLILSIESHSALILSFTGLEIIMSAIAISMYRWAVHSNAIYQQSAVAVIGIGGDSGAGKSTLLQDIQALLGHRMIQIEGDGDHKWERGHASWQTFTHLDPKANNLHRQAQDILQLKAGKPITRRDYDHDTGQFTPEQRIEPADYLVACGLHPFYLPLMRRLIDIKLFLNTDDALRVQWKVQRDHQNRGYTEAEVLQQLSHRQLDSQRYILPQKDFADMVITYFQTNNGTLGLEIRLPADIDLTKLINTLMDTRVTIFWTYSEDLKTQNIQFDGPLSPLILNQLLETCIPNAEELITMPVQWAEGLRGTVQFLIILMISQHNQFSSV